jgi:multiple sugar transport system permease protein
VSAVVPARGSAPAPVPAPAPASAAWSPWPRRRKAIRRALLIGLLVAGGILMMVPFLWMISTSLKTRAEVFAIPRVLFPANPRFENYGEMWNALPFAAFFVNSVKLAALNTIGTLISCSMAAFAFAVLRFPFRGPLFGLLLVTLIIPFQVVLIPNFILYRLLPHPFSTSGNWIGTHEPLWVGAFLGGAFGTFLLRQFFLTIPRELADAARVDGANPWQIYRLIYLPLAKPALATLAIFTFMWSWNDFINPIIYLRDVESFTLTAGLSLFQGQYVGKWPLLMAGALVSVIPMIVLFVLAQRQFVRGIALTGIKG